MNFLIDTSVLVDHLRGFEPAKNLIRRVREKEFHAFISSITEAELFAGKDVKQESRQLELMELISLFEKIILENKIAQKSGELRRNYDIELPDAIIAATAFHSKCVVLTKNKKHFGKIKEIKVEEPY